MLRVDLTDAPADLDALFVTIDSVDIRIVREGSDQQEWLTVSTGSVTLDLLLLEDVFAPLGIASVLPEGRVTGIRLIVTGAEAIVSGETVDVKVPSGPETGLKIDVGFMLVEGATARVLLDFDARESVVEAPGQGLILKPVIEVLEITSPITADGGVLSTQGGVRLIVPKGAVAGPTPVLVTLRDLAGEDLDAALASPLPADQYSFLGGINLDVTAVDGSRVEFRKNAELEVDNVSGLTREDQIPLASLVRDVTGDAKKDLVLSDTAYALGSVVRTARNGFLPGIRASGSFVLLASTTGLTYVHGTTRGIRGGEGVVARVFVESTPSVIAAVSDRVGRYVVPVPFPSAAPNLSLTDPLIDRSTMTLLDLTNASSGSFIDTTPDPEDPIDIDVVGLGETALAHGWGDADPLAPINVMFQGSSSRTFHIAVAQHGRFMRAAVGEIVFPNPCIPPITVATDTQVINGSMAFLLKFPRPSDFPAGWQLHSDAQPFIRFKIRTWGVDEAANVLLSTGPTNFDIPLIVDGFNPDVDNDGVDDQHEVFLYGTSPFVVDSDGDGFDDVEEAETGRDGFDLEAAGARGYKKDIFVELDWMAATNNPFGIGDHTHKVGPSARSKIRKAFAKECIAIHLDVGQAPYFGGNRVAHRRELLGNCDEDPNLTVETEVMNEVIAIRSIHSAPNRNRVFHYGLLAHHACASNPFGGLGVVGPSADAKNFVVTLGINPFLSGSQVSAEIGETIMHELGHNLSLRHGGDQNCPNHMPNYVSVMNYRYSLRGELNLHLGSGIDFGTLHGGVDVDCDAVGDGVYGYSHGDLFNLDELSLNERVGICRNRAIDWDNDGQLEIDVTANLTPNTSNCPDDEELTILQDHDDWSGLSHFTGLTDAFVPAEIAVCLEP